MKMRARRAQVSHAVANWLGAVENRTPCPNFSTLAGQTGVRRARIGLGMTTKSLRVSSPTDAGSFGNEAAARQVGGTATLRRRISRRRFLKTVGATGAALFGLTGYGFAVEPMWRLAVTRYRISPRQLAARPQPQDRRDRRRACRRADHAGRAHRRHRPAHQRAQARHHRPARRLHRQPQVQDPLRHARGVVGSTGRAQGAARRACRARQSRLVGRPRTRSAPARAPCSAGACWSGSASPSTRTTSPASARTATPSGSPASATRSPSSPAGARSTFRKFEGVDDLPGTLAKITDDAPVILLAHEPDIFSEVPSRVVAHAVRPHPRRPGARVRLLADGALALRQPLRLRPRRGGRPPPHHLRRARLLDPARAHRHAARDRDGGCHSLTHRPTQPAPGPIWPAASSPTPTAAATCSRSASTSRTPTSPASSITAPTCAGASAAAPTSCA